jgi:hypothetical protein
MSILTDASSPEPKPPQRRGPLHWCEVLEQEHAAVAAARSGRVAPPAERHPRDWFFQPDDLLDVEKLIVTLQEEAGLWAWVGTLPDKAAAAGDAKSAPKDSASPFTKSSSLRSRLRRETPTITFSDMTFWTWVQS